MKFENFVKFSENFTLVDDKFISVVLFLMKLCFSCHFQVSASDPDCGFDSKVTYTIADGMGYKKPTEFYIERNSGRICVAKRLDYEKKSVFEFPIRADDRGKITFFFTHYTIFIILI